MKQSGDVRLFQTPEDGEIEVSGGLIAMDGGMYTATYLSLFGAEEWWGNELESDPDRQLKSATMRVLEGFPATSANLQRVEDAVASDLAWIEEEITVEVSIPQLNRVKITVNISGTVLNLESNWGGFEEEQVGGEIITPEEPVGFMGCLAISPFEIEATPAASGCLAMEELE